jgi:phosphopantetheinyl transferase
MDVSSFSVANLQNAAPVVMVSGVDVVNCVAEPRAICCRAHWDQPAGLPEAGCIQSLLSAREHRFWIEMRGVEKRRREWLLGRAAAKDAVGRLMAREHGLRLAPADIEILPDGYGCPQVAGAWIEPGIRPAISIAHSGNLALALAAAGADLRVGIDLENLRHRREDFEAVAFTAAERSLLDQLPGDLRQEWALRMWCAKEAVGKASGRGLSAGLTAFRIPRLDPASGSIPVEFGAETWMALTTREAGFVFAAIISSRRDSSRDLRRAVA